MCTPPHPPHPLTTLLPLDIVIAFSSTGGVGLSSHAGAFSSGQIESLSANSRQLRSVNASQKRPPVPKTAPTVLLPRLAPVHQLTSVCACAFISQLLTQHPYMVVTAQAVSNLSGHFFSTLGESCRPPIKGKKCGLMEFIYLCLMLPTPSGTCCSVSRSHPLPDLVKVQRFQSCLHWERGLLMSSSFPFRAVYILFRQPSH